MWLLCWYALYGTNYERFVCRSMLPAGTKTKVLTKPQLPLHQVVTDEISSDDDYKDDSVFMAIRRKLS